MTESTFESATAATSEPRTAPAPAIGLTPYLHVDGVREAIDFYTRAFGAREVAAVPAEDGERYMHAHVEINGSPLFMSDFFPEHGHAKVTPQSFMLHLQVDDADQWWTRAVEAGCEIVSPLKIEFWGDYYGQIRDPFGVMWSIGQSGMPTA